METQPAQDSALKAKVILVLFGALLGGLLVFGAKKLLLKPQEGTVFNSVDDFRKALSDPRGNGTFHRKDGLPFVAVIQPHQSDQIIYTMRPNLNDRFTNVPVRTNSHGMRGPEVTFDKPAGTYRLALLGDSFAFGWGVDEDKIFAKVLEDDLAAGLKQPVQVLNFGVPGYSTFQEVAAFQEQGIKFHPDGVLVFFIENDFDFPFFIRDPSSSNGLVESFTLKKVGDKELHPLLQHERMAEQGLDPNASLARLDDQLRAANIPLYLAVNPRKDWKRIVNKLTILKERPSIHLLPIGEEFEKIVADNHYTPEQLNLPNDPHPTALRHKIYGDLLADRILTLMHGGAAQRQGAGGEQSQNDANLQASTGAKPEAGHS